MQWISRLTKALEEDRFQLFFQPIEPINSSNSGMKKCELLIRMIDQEGNTIMPADFIPAAERYNLMPAVDRWVVQNAFKAYKLLSDELGQDRNPFSLPSISPVLFSRMRPASTFSSTNFRNTVFPLPPSASR